MAEPRDVKVGLRTLKFPSKDLQVLEPCNHLLNDVSALRQLMEEKGYMYVKGLHDRQEVLAARKAVLEYLADLGDKLSGEHPLGEGVLKDGCGLGCLPFMEGRNEVTECREVKAVIEGRRPHEFFKKYFDADVKTFDYKWLRAVHQQGYTGAHVDNVYMSRGSSKLHTMWTPIGDVPIEMGVLAVCEGSHRLPEFQKFQETYGNMDAEQANLKGTGWFTEDPIEITESFGGQWKTTDFEAGDVLIFGMRTVHMSTTNTTHFARISCDTRWQPAQDPLDPRYNGDFQKTDAKFGLQSMTGGEPTSVEKGITIENLKASWGLQ